MNLTCICFGHRYRVIQTFPGLDGRHIGCPRCLRSWGMHDPTRSMIKWADVEHIYREQGYILRKWPLPGHRAIDPVFLGLLTFCVVQLLISLFIA